MSKSIFVYSNTGFQQCMKKIDHVTQYILNEENLSCDIIHIQNLHNCISPLSNFYLYFGCLFSLVGFILRKFIYVPYNIWIKM